MQDGFSVTFTEKEARERADRLCRPADRAQVVAKPVALQRVDGTEVRQAIRLIAERRQSEAALAGRRVEQSEKRRQRREAAIRLLG
jgi:hypothetical protein